MYYYIESVMAVDGGAGFMGYKNMIFDVMVLNMENQLIELSHERFGKPFEKCDDLETYHILMLLNPAKLTSFLTASLLCFLQRLLQTSFS